MRTSAITSQQPALSRQLLSQQSGVTAPRCDAARGGDDSVDWKTYTKTLRADRGRCGWLRQRP
jgi:hypothetical protein